MTGHGLNPYKKSDDWATGGWFMTWFNHIVPYIWVKAIIFH